MKFSIAFLALFGAATVAHAQIVPPPASGNLNVNSLTSTTNITANKYVGGLDTGTNVALPGSNGAFILGNNFIEQLILQDMSATAGNRRGVVEFHAGYTGLGFMNDQTGGRIFGVTINGGAADGISGITSSSGSGVWAHTGPMTVSGTFQASGGEKLQTFLTAAIPTCSAGNTGLLIAVTDVGGTPAWNGTLPAGTGTPAAATTFSVFCDGTDWRIH